MTRKFRSVVLSMFASALLSGCNPEPVAEVVSEDEPARPAEIKYGYADSNGVKIHYAELGAGPLVVMIHGFPDFWYSWRRRFRTLRFLGYAELLQAELSGHLERQ